LNQSKKHKLDEQIASLGYFEFDGRILAVPLLIAFFITGWGAPGTAV
jgi:hypothetical protein